MKHIVASTLLGLGLSLMTVASAAAAAAAGAAVPAMIAASQVSVQAQVGADDRTVDLTLQDPAALKGFQAGDQVEGSYLQVLAIGVVSPPAKK